LQLLGPVDPREIKDVIAEIESEGNRFLDVPRPLYDTPFYTAGREAMRKQAEDLMTEEGEDGCTDGT
jgi:hypothetical protein